ncbi:MAG TPA: HEAT repeat domain-containing protein, partial [Pyrinomonadaceae bacterium]
MPRQHLFPRTWRLVVILLALLSPLFFMSGQAGAQKKKQQQKPPQPSATPVATQATQSQTTSKSQKLNLVRMRSSDTSDGSNVSLESDGVLNKYSAYRNGDRFYVVVPDLDAQRAQSSLRGRGYENVQVQKNGNDTVLMFRLQPGAKASVRQKFNRLDVVFTTPEGANQNSTPQAQPTPATNANQSGTRTPTPTQGGTTVTQPNGLAPNGGTPSTNATGNQTPGANPYIPGAAPIIATSPTPAGGPSPATVETPATNAAATPPADQVAQVSNPTTAQPPSATSQQPTSTTPTLATTLARSWGLLLIIGLVLISLGLVVAARSKARRGAADAKAKEQDAAFDARAAKAAEAANLKVIAPAATTAAVAAGAAKKRDKAKTTAGEQNVERASAFKEPLVKPGTSRKAVAEKDAAKEAAKEAVPVTRADIESASGEVRKLLAGESYDEAVIASSDRGTRQAVAAELLGALASRNVERQERARTAFVKHNYLDEATYDLRTAEAPAERASAARSLGLSREQAATPHLVAALEDNSPEVRRAVVEALSELGDAAAVAPLEALLEREHDRKVPHSLIRRAIEASTVAAVADEKEETPTLESAPAAAAVDAAPAAAAVGEETQTLEAHAPLVEAAAPVQEQPVSEAVPAVEEEKPEAAPTAQEETQTVEAAPVEAASANGAASVEAESAHPSTVETAAIVASAAALLTTEASPTETPAEASVPLSGEIVAPAPQ